MGLRVVDRLVAPLQDRLSYAGRDYKFGMSRKQSRAVLAGDGLVIHRHVEYGGKLVIHVVALYGFESHLFGNHLAVLVREHVILLAPHRADHMAGRREDTLDKGILTRRDLRPVRKGVAL